MEELICQPRLTELRLINIIRSQSISHSEFAFHMSSAVPLRWYRARHDLWLRISTIMLLSLPKTHDIVEVTRCMSCNHC
jgi:hypothetical protein